MSCSRVPYVAPQHVLPLPQHILEQAVANAISEDFGLLGDITSAALFHDNRVGKFRIIARSNGVLCGVDFAHETIRLANRAHRSAEPNLDLAMNFADGDQLHAGCIIGVISGHLGSILAVERILLNFLGYLSGISSLTASYVKELANDATRITCTRKTTPGNRALEKYAVRCGGGFNHRMGLYDGAMIKDNHIAGSPLADIVAKVRRGIGHTTSITIEVDNLEQLAQVIGQPHVSNTASLESISLDSVPLESIFCEFILPDIILLDNMSIDQITEAVEMIKSPKVGARIVIEVSGNVTPNDVGPISRAGVDVISVGRLTHSARWLDLSLEAIS